MDYVALFTLLLNIGAICFTGYQVLQNTKSLRTAQQAFELERKRRQVELLPKAHFIIQLQTHLERWIEALRQISTNLTTAIAAKDSVLLKKTADSAMRTSKGIVDRYLYATAPEWLRGFLMSGAQFYFRCHPSLYECWNRRTDKPEWSLAATMLDVCNESIDHLTNIIEYIEDTVPTSYLETPATLGDEDFLGD